VRDRFSRPETIGRINALVVDAFYRRLGYEQTSTRFAKKPQI
jgi:hypothetical protein